MTDNATPVTAPSLKRQLRDDLTTSMKARDELTTATLRMLISAVMNAEVAGKSQIALTDDQVIDVLRSECKKRAESAEVYRANDRAAMADREAAELGVLQRYLPAAMSDDDLIAIANEEIAALAAAGTTGPRAMGIAVKAVRGRAGSGADGGRVAAVVKAALGL